MPRIRPVDWKTFEKFLLRVGCVFVREKGDHRIYRREDVKRPVVVPQDSTLPVFVIRNNLRILNITREQYLEILETL